MSTKRRETFDFLVQHESGNSVRVEVVIDAEALARRYVRRLLGSTTGRAQLGHGAVKLSIRKRPG